ncbi:hypothetical protein LSUB1_G008935 [Lachnellula subtilissima]|uniref:Transposase MuDR plant domain-containing protein n=1 Tax=Lachnellula subtilissima TaxID=602034 RepID=A0A8H8RC58_9HELO|nr:hypothetical protein LSUB1_G008935 [Lachnellula subtilissima]
MPPLQLREEFPTLKAFKDALHAWAIEAHFEPRILKSDTGRVRVGCKRDPNCPFVVRCNWERKNGREPLARVTVLRDRHTCLNGIEWTTASPLAGMNGMGNGMGVGGGIGGGVGGGPPGMGGGNVNGMSMSPQVGIRQDEEGNIVGGARVLGPIDKQGGPNDVGPPGVPVLPKVQRNSASRLPFLMDILPRLMIITKDTTPIEIRECLLREYGAEVHLQQCRRAKTEILKKRLEDGSETPGQGQNNHGQRPDTSHRMDSVDMGSDSTNEPSNKLFGDMNGNGNGNGNNPNGNRNNVTTPNQSTHPFTLHAANGVVAPPVPARGAAALRAVGEQPIKCPYCINSRWMSSIKDAVEHMSLGIGMTWPKYLGYEATASLATS